MNKTYTLPEIMNGQKLGLEFRLDTVVIGPVTLAEGQYRTELISENYGMIGIVSGGPETVLTCEAVEPCDGEFGCPCPEHEAARREEV